jgi:hypothetical protein
MRLRRRLAAVTAVLSATGTVLLGTAGPAAALPPITPVQPTPCYVNPGLCLYAEPGRTGFTAWSLWDVSTTPYYYSIFNETTGTELKICPTGISCTAEPPAREYPAPGRCMSYIAYIGGTGGVNHVFPPAPVQRRSAVVTLCA